MSFSAIERSQISALKMSGFDLQDGGLWLAVLLFGVRPRGPEMRHTKR
jgi:hypothetical protein